MPDQAEMSRMARCPPNFIVLDLHGVSALGDRGDDGAP